MKWLKIIGVVVLIMMIVGGFLYLKKEVNAEKEALKQVIKRQEEWVKEKDRRVQELESQLEVLRREQVLREKRIAELKKKRVQIRKPETVEEIVKELKELGYEVVVR